MALIAVLTTIPCAVPAQELPLFEAFTRFCADTGVKPVAVRAALEVAGAKNISSPDASSSPLSIAESLWEIELGGRMVRIGFGDIPAPARYGRPNARAGHCIASSEEIDDSSVDAIKDWVGVAPWPSTGAVTIYRYVETEIWHAAPPGEKDAYDAAMDRGMIWTVRLLRLNQRETVGLFHTLPAER